MLVSGHMGLLMSESASYIPSNKTDGQPEQMLGCWCHVLPKSQLLHTVPASVTEQFYDMPFGSGPILKLKILHSNGKLASQRNDHNFLA